VKIAGYLHHVKIAGYLHHVKIAKKARMPRSSKTLLSKIIQMRDHWLC